MATIFELIDEGDTDGIRALLAADPAARDARDAGGLSPLMQAVYQGGGPALAALLEAGEPADPWDRLVAGYADGLPAPDASRHWGRVPSRVRSASRGYGSSTAPIRTS